MFGYLFTRLAHSRFAATSELVEVIWTFQMPPFVFGEVLGKKSVFLIQNMFPTTEKYILSKYITENVDVEITEKVKKKIIAYSRQVIKMEQKGIQIAFNNLSEMKELLLNSLK